MFVSKHIAEAHSVLSGGTTIVRRLAEVIEMVRRRFVEARRRRIAIVELNGMSRAGLRDLDLDRTETLCAPRRPLDREGEIEAWARHARLSNGFGDAVVDLRQTRAARSAG